MLCLLFQVCGCRYAIEVRRVVEVVPRVPLRPLPQAPDFLAGLFDYGGTVVPVIDLGRLFDGEACRSRLSTRIVVVDYPLDAERTRWLGLVAEQVNEIRAVPDPIVEDRPGAEPADGFLGRIVQLDRELVQMLRIENLLGRELRDRLFGVVLGAAG